MRRLDFLVKLIIMVILATGLTAAWEQDQDVNQECDLKKIEQVYWCNDCESPCDLVKGYVCGDCDSKSDKPGKCPDCEVERKKAVWCKSCEGIVSDKKVDVCVKTGYTCEDCGTQSFKPGKCSGCEESLKEVAVKCRIVYKCSGCGHSQFEPGKCEQDEDSECYGKALTKSCAQSGTFPHVKQE